MGYTEKNVTVYNDETMPGVTSQPFFQDITYVDKHPQPSRSQVLPNSLKHYYGKMTADVIASNVPREEASGDVHIAIYDFKNQIAL